METFKLFDLFPRVAQLKIGDSFYYRNIKGSFLTLFLIFLIILLIIGFGRDLFEKRYPEISFNKETFDKQFFNLSDSLFMLNFHTLDTKLIPNETQKLFPYIIWQDVDPERLKEGKTSMKETFIRFEKFTPAHIEN